MLDVIDGLILAGGNDVDPAEYGAEPHRRDPQHRPRARPLRARARPRRGRARHAGARDLPRNAGDQRRLRRNAAPAPARRGRPRARTARNPGSFENSDHEVRLTDGSLAALAAGEAVHNTKSHHHQGVEAVAEPFEVTGYSSLDGLPEAIEAPGLSVRARGPVAPRGRRAKPRDRGAGRRAPATTAARASRRSPPA